MQLVQGGFERRLVVGDQALDLGGEQRGVVEQRVDRLAAGSQLGEQEVAVADQRRQLLVAIGEDARDPPGFREQAAHFRVA